MDMTPQEYQEYVRRRAPKSPIWKNTALAFATGGAICMLGQLIMNPSVRTQAPPLSRRVLHR